MIRLALCDAVAACAMPIAGSSSSAAALPASVASAARREIGCLSSA